MLRLRATEAARVRCAGMTVLAVAIGVQSKPCVPLVLRGDRLASSE